MTRLIIDELLEELERNVRLLEPMRELTEDEFVADPHQYLFAERCFQLAIQCLLDVSLYIASQKGWQKPPTAADAVALLGRQGVLDQDFAATIVGMANFRNILVHAYLKIDRRKVYSFLDDLEDFREFTRQVLRFIEAEG